MARRQLTRETKNGTKPAQRDTAISNRMRRWQNNNGITKWNERKRNSAAKDKPRRPKVVKKKRQPRAKPKLRVGGMERDVVNCEPHPSAIISDGGSANHVSTRARVGPYPLVSDDALPSSWETTDSVDFGGHAATCYPPIPESYSSLGFEQPPAYGDDRFEGEDHSMGEDFGGNHFDCNNSQWEPTDHADMFFPFDEPESLPTTNSHLDNSSSNIDTQRSLLNGGVFRFIQPRTTARIESIELNEDLARAEYASWMSVEAPENFMPGNYNEQLPWSRHDRSEMFS